MVKNILTVIALSTLFLFSCAPKETVQPPQKPVKIALVLGAGASKGFAHSGDGCIA